MMGAVEATHTLVFDRPNLSPYELDREHRSHKTSKALTEITFRDLSTLINLDPLNNTYPNRLVK